MKYCNNHKQQPRSGKILPVALALLAFFCFGKMQAQGVKIHQLGLGDGDCTLIEIIDYKPNMMVPTLDTAIILIDAQRNKQDASFEIIEFIENKLGPKGLNRKIIDYVILSHVHIDHYGNMVDALESLMDSDYEVSYVFDRLALNETDIDWDLNDIDECYDELSTGKLSASANAYKKFIKENFPTSNFPIFAGSDLLDNRFTNTRMLCVAAFGSTIDPTDGSKLFFIPWTGSVYKPKSENDLSFAFLLSYGGFRYFTGGDLGGQDNSGYANGEVPVAEYLKAKGGTNFHFCAFKVSHHGSEESTSEEFLALVNPTLAIVPASLRTYGRSTNPLPRCNTLDNLAEAKVATIAFTFVPNGDQKDLKNFCRYRNLDHTQDVTLVVNAADVGDAINMHLTFQGRNDRFDISGSPTYSDVQCTKVHTKGPFSAVMQQQVMMDAMDSTAVIADSIQGQRHGELVPQPNQQPALKKQEVQKTEVQDPMPAKKKPAAKNRKKKKKHNH